MYQEKLPSVKSRNKTKIPTVCSTVVASLICINMLSGICDMLQHVEWHLWHATTCWVASLICYNMLSGICDMLQHAEWHLWCYNMLSGISDMHQHVDSLFQYKTKNNIASFSQFPLCSWFTKPDITQQSQTPTNKHLSTTIACNLFQI
jgi:hypothetical protein